MTVTMGAQLPFDPSFQVYPVPFFFTFDSYSYLSIFLLLFHSLVFFTIRLSIVLFARFCFELNQKPNTKQEIREHTHTQQIKIIIIKKTTESYQTVHT